MIVRSMLCGTGAVLLTAATGYLIEANGFVGWHATLIGSMALGTAAASIAFARTSGGVRIACVAAALCGEAAGGLMIADRIVANADVRQAPARQAARDRTEAQTRLTAAEALLATTPATSARLAAAIASKSAADQAVLSKADARSCASNCRELLSSAAADAEREVSSARAELTDFRKQREVAVDRTRTELAAIKVPAITGSALADRLQVSPAAVDLMMAGLTLVGSNVLAALLIAAGAHAPSAASTIPTPISPPVRTPARLPGISARDHGTRFFRDALAVRSGSTTPVYQLAGSYKAWCGLNGVTPLPDAEIGSQLMNEFQQHDIRGDAHDGRPVLIGISLAQIV